MSVLSRLFGKAKKKQPETRANKITALESMTPDALMAIALAEKGEQDDQLRVAAIERLDDLNTLAQIAFGSAGNQVQRIARQRLAALVDKGTLDFDQLSTQLSDPSKLFAVMSFSRQTERLEQLLSAINDSALLYKMASEGATVKLRQIAAEKIDDREQLQFLLKETKGKDKAIYKIVKDKCDKFREEEKAIAATQTAIETLTQALVQHSQRSFDVHFTAKFQLLQQQWQPLSDQASEAQREQANQAILTCQATIDAVEAAEAEAEAKAIELASADQQRQEILHALAALVRQLAVGEPVDEAQIQQLTAQWQEAATHKPATAGEQKSFATLNEMIPALQQHLARYGSIADHVAILVNTDHTGDDHPPVYRHLKQRLDNKKLFAGDSLPQPILEAQHALEQWDKQRQEKKAEQSHLQRQIGGLIRKAKDASTTGKLQQAAGLRRAIEDKLAQAKAVPAHLQNQLQQLDEMLDKLQDWKDYAVLPKKHELIAQMKAFIGSDEHPEALSIKIKRLQDEWKSLSKGGGLHKENQEQDQELWEAFHEAAQVAFQPCRDYFAEQAAIRQRNLESCKALVEQLKTYEANYAWESADWKAVEKVVRLARQEWRSYSPTERAATQPVLAEFEAVLERIDNKLNDERKKNAALKQNLIVRAQQLLEQEDTRAAIEEVKQLQTQWQHIGVMARSLDQKLWREFRAACDAIFAKKQQQTAEFKEELEANLTAAEQMIGSIQQLMALGGQALMDARKEVEALQQQFAALGLLPKAKANEIKQAFTQAVEAFEAKIKRERQLARQQVWLNLFAANDQLRECQWSLLKVADNERADRAKAEAMAGIHTEQLPTGGAKALQQKLELDLAKTDINQNLLALRLLCIRADILSGSTTPAVDQALRMEYQVKQLEQNFGQKPADTRTAFDELIFEWLAVGPVSGADYAPLFNRFHECWLKIVR
ncbi:MAG TPA: DUF349 domain-containing protein [Cellvibrio sp.]|nr:DUF349 domain-containing protein [Cellvibrio sp.]